MCQKNGFFFIEGFPKGKLNIHHDVLVSFNYQASVLLITSIYMIRTKGKLNIQKFCTLTKIPKCQRVVGDRGFRTRFGIGFLTKA